MTYLIMTDRGWRPFHSLNKPCPNSNDLKGVHRPVPQMIAEAQNERRSDRWGDAVQYADTRRSQFSGDNFNEPIFGAFGEKL